jgi:hypothetical protein
MVSESHCALQDIAIAKKAKPNVRPCKQRINIATKSNFPTGKAFANQKCRTRS